MRKYLPVLVLLVATQSVFGVKIADITRIGGQRTNVLTGTGLVYGLKGSGDGGDFLPAIRPLAAMLAKFSNPAEVIDLKNASNVAIVALIATVPSNGVHNGDHIDVRVMSLGAAGSLQGGYLFVTPMKGPMPEPSDRARLPFALSDGPLVIEDTSNPNLGVIKGGCVMETDLSPKQTDDGKFTLVLEDPSASWETASTIATVINQSEGDGDARLATAADAKNIVVTVPAADRENPASFIARVLRLPVPETRLATEARVVINEKTGSIILTSDVEISPCVICVEGLTISTVEPKPVPTQRMPVTTKKSVATMDTTGLGSAKLQDLALAFDQLKVPPKARVEIIKELYKTGKLHAKLIVNGTER